MVVHLTESQNLHGAEKERRDHPIQSAHSTDREPKAQKGRLVQSHLVNGRPPGWVS